jgi:hypothetical protein
MEVTPQPLIRQESLVKLAAYAAFACAGVSVLAVGLTVITLSALKDPSNQALTPTLQSIHALLVAAAWGFLLVVAIGLSRFQPPSTTSKIGLLLAGVGAVIVVLSALVAVVGPSGADFLAPHDTEAGEMAIGVWLLMANSDLRKRAILSRGLTQVGILFGAALALTSISLLLNVRVLSAGLFVTAGILAWPTWLGVVLLRRTGEPPPLKIS